jgi:lipopolysaccharide exporter
MRSRPEGIAAAAIAGTRWNYLGGIVSSLGSLTIGVALARLLGPRPYGQIIIAGTIYGIVNLFVDGGFSQALIQKRTLDRRQIRRTFTVQVALGAKATAIVYVLAPWIARQFHDPSAAHVIQAMSLMIVLQSFGLVSTALLRREMQFKTIQYAGVASYLAGYLLLGIPLACAGLGVWSLVAAYLCQCLLNSVLLYAAVRHSLVPSFGFPDQAATTFGGTIVANNLVNWGHANLDNLAASQLGPIGLGLYGRACNFAYQPVNAIVTGLQSVLVASAARSQDRQGPMRDLTVSAMAIVFGVLGPAYAVLAMTSETAITGLFGDKWLALVPLMLPLALAMPIYGAHCLLGPIVCGIGRPALEFWPQAISCFVAAIAFFSAAHWSLIAIAWALPGVVLLRFGLTSAFVFRLLQVSWGRMLRILGMRMVFAAAFGTLAWLADQILRSPFHLAAGARLIALFVFCSVGLGCTIWTAGELVFGHDAIAFLNLYAEHLPGRYVQQLRWQARRRPTNCIVANSANGTPSAGVTG